MVKKKTLIIVGVILLVIFTFGTVKKEYIADNSLDLLKSRCSLFPDGIIYSCTGTDSTCRDYCMDTGSGISCSSSGCGCDTLVWDCASDGGTQCDEYAYYCEGDDILVSECGTSVYVTTCIGTCDDGNTFHTYSTERTEAQIVEELCTSSSDCETDSQCPTGESCNLGECKTFCEIQTQNGASFTYCNGFDDGICSGDDRYYCNAGYGYTIGGGTGIWQGDNYVCVVGDVYSNAPFMSCPNGCSNGVCAQQVCQPNTQWCDGMIVYECSSDGMTETIRDTCTSSEVCQENSPSDARCVSTTQFYCVGQTDCYISDTNTGNCYATLNECETAFDQSYSDCFNGDVYWFSATDSPTTKKEECGTNSCVNGECVGSTPDPTPTPEIGACLSLIEEEDEEGNCKPSTIIIIFGVLVGGAIMLKVIKSGKK